MPRAPAKIRKRYVEGTTEVLDWQVEETLLYGATVIIGPPCMFHTRDEWQREWDRWGETILPKCIEHRPGTRPFAMYALGMIPARELRMPLPVGNGYWYADVRDRNGNSTRHYLDVPEPFIEREVNHLRRLGIVDADEYQRYRQWTRRKNPECDQCAIDSYPLEMSLYE